MNQDDLKRAAAEAALRYVEPGSVIGVGTGSTTNHFIDLLAERRVDIEAAVPSSEATAARLRRHGIPLIELNAAGDLPLYVDGADECNPLLQLIKGGGGALTREKVIAAASRRFVCILDRSKYVRALGAFPLPIEVIPMARSFVARRLVALGGHPVWREHFVTDNGNQILDVHGLDMSEPIRLERELNDIPGIVTVGLFALRGADIVLMADEDGVHTLTA